MTDIRRPSAQDKIPPPPPELDTSGSKGMHRSKTVRNLNSAGNKVKGLFKPKEKRKTEERPPITTSLSFGPGDQVIHEAYYQGNKIKINISPPFFFPLSPPFGCISLF